MVYFKTAFALGALCASVAQAVTPLVARGANFVNSVDGGRFQIIGVAYQPGGSSGFDPGSGVDPLSDGDVCLRDAILLQRLGVNTIRVYNLDPDLDHTACASVFNAAGIYMILDVNSPLPNQSLNRGAPWESYNSDYLQRVFQVIEGFKNFNNTLGFFSANEVINEQSVVEVPAYIRAVTRDMKDFIAKQSSRVIPVGYSAADVRPLLHDTFEYLGCELSNETSSKMDFFGLNSYSWCGNATFESSGYDVLVSDFSNTTVPIFFSEYGCNQVKPREFSEVQALYGSEMTGVFSGGLVYEYSEEPNNYGLVTINDDGSISLKSDYSSLMTQYNQIDLQALTSANSTATNLHPPTCSADLITSNLTNSFDIPARPDGVQDFIDNGVNSNNGSFPTGTTSVSNTAEPASVTDANGNQISGLSLTVLANDAYNLPGNNTSGTGNASTTSSGSNPSSTNAAPAYKAHGGAMVLGALTVGFLAQL